MRPSTLILLLSSAVASSNAFVINVPHNIPYLPSKSGLARQEANTRSAFGLFGHTKLAPVDAVRYNPSSPESNCDDEYDTIVIGSGVGGLAAASCLAQSHEKHKVLVLEQYDVCGGCCHAFESGGYRFGTGIHYIGEVGDKGGALDGTQLNLKKIIDSVALENDPIEFSPMDDNYDTAVFGMGEDVKKYTICGGGIKAQKEHLKDQFPIDTHEAIDKFFSLVQKATRSLIKRGLVFKYLPLPLSKVLVRSRLYRLLDGGMHKYLTTSLRDVVKSITDNEELQAVLCYVWGDLGASPDEIPFGPYSIAWSHFCNGAYYPRGGPQNIPRKIIPAILASGGKVLTRAPVEQITVDEQTGRATGVKLKDGRVIKARKAVISDAGIVNTFRHLLPPSLECRKKMLKSLFRPSSRYKNTRHDRLHSSKSGMALFVGLKGDHDEDFHLPHGQYWRHSSTSPAVVDDNFKKLERMSLDEAISCLKPEDISPIFVGSPSAKDDTWKNDYPGKTVLEIFTFVPWKWFEKWRAASDTVDQGGSVDVGGKPGSHGETYEIAKKQIAELMWSNTVDLLSSCGVNTLPSTLEEVDFYKIGTPLTFAHYLHSSEGGWYGLEQDMVRFEPRTFIERLRPDVSEVPGLYLSGQDMFTDGFVSAAGAGMACAGKILGLLNPYSCLRLADKDHSKGEINQDIGVGLGYVLGIGV